ncbi:MAG: type II toxin-antitoxin system ParD family antitoxin [Blastocatellia bacterium]
MNVSLTPELEKMVNDKVTSGFYTSASEVVREALRLLQEFDEARRRRIEELRKEIDAGAEQIRQGQYKVYESADEFMDDIVNRGKERLAARQDGQN